MDASIGAGSEGVQAGRSRAQSVDVRHMTPDQVQSLISAARKHSRHGKRDAAVIGLMYRHGLRVSELCGLRTDDIDITAATLRVRRAKGGQDAIHPLYAEDVRALRQRPENASPWLFVNERGSPLSPHGVREIFRRLAPLAGIPADLCHPHALRHGCGYKLVNDGVSLPLIAAYLGHRSIKHTARYTAVDSRRFRDFRF